MTNESNDSDTDDTVEQFTSVPEHLRERFSSRREFLSDSALIGTGALALSAGSGVAAAHDDEDEKEEGEDEKEAADEDEDDDEPAGGGPQGFNVEVIAPHAEFPGDVSAMFKEAGPDGVTRVPDASTVIFVKATFEPGGTSGWHIHPGPGIGNLAQGELEVQTADCSSFSASAGDALVVPENEPRIGTNPSDDERAVLYVAFLGIPDGVIPIEFVEPPECVDEDDDNMQGGMNGGRGHD